MDHVEVDGLRIAFRHRGVGPALVLLHGGLSDSRVWRLELTSFADAFTVVAWDAPGCGDSSDAPADWTMADYATCLAGFIDALGVGPAHVLGHSWGSTLALELLVGSASLVRTLVLAGAYAGWAGSLPSEEVHRRLASVLELAGADGAGGFAQTMPGIVSEAMPPERADELATIMAASRPAATRTMAAALAHTDLRALLPAIAVPTLVVCGEHDVRSPVPVGVAIQQAIPGAELVVLPGVGHESFLESPEAFDGAVRRFILAH